MALIEGLGVPWIVVGDWNATVEELAKAGVFEMLGGEPVQPNNVDFKCTAGSCRMIDFANGIGEGEGPHKNMFGSYQRVVGIAFRHKD